MPYALYERATQTVFGEGPANARLVMIGEQPGDHEDKEGHPFGTTRDELWSRFSPHFELLEEWVPRSYPNRTGLELMLWWRRKRS